MLAFVLALGTASAQDAVPEVVGEPTDSATALDDAAYRFCHVAGANAEQAREWCDLLATLPEDRCPGMRETCNGAVSADPVGCMPLGGGGGRANGLGGEPERPAARTDWGCDEFDTDGLQSLLRWVAAVGVAVLVAVLLRAVVRSFGRRKPSDRADDLVSSEVADPELDPDALPAGLSGDLLAGARTALREGRHADAALLARAAALRVLGEAERLRLHRSRTDREYVRALGRHRSPTPTQADQAQRDLQGIMRVVELVRFGGKAIAAGEAEGAVQSAERIAATCTQPLQA